MVEKSPFLCEQDFDSQYTLRDSGVFRSLGPLFPSASLKLLTHITQIANNISLPTGSMRMPLGERGAKGKGGRDIRVAAHILHQNYSEEVPLKTWDNYLKLAVDMRLLRLLPQQYVVHSYARPILAIANSSPETWYGSDSWCAYFIDRLLYEDADNLLAAISLLSDKSKISATVFELGRYMRKIVTEKIQRIIADPSIDRNIRLQLSTKSDRPESNRLRIYKKPNTRKTEEKAKRRIELEFTVRRDWLCELRLAQKENGQWHLTGSGEKLWSGLSGMNNLPLEFFTKRIVQLLATIVADAQWNEIDEVTVILERLFSEIAPRQMRIVESLILVNTAIFTSIPIFYGERDDILNILQLSANREKTTLLLQSGYRTPNYYVKSRT